MGLHWRRFGGNLATIQGIFSIRPAGCGVIQQFESVTYWIGRSWTVLGVQSAFRGLGFNSWVFNTSIEMSFKTDKDKLPQYLQAIKGQTVLKKVAEFYSQVPMPCVVNEPLELFPKAKKPKYHVIPDATHETYVRLMEERPDYKKAAAIVRILEKSAHRL
ncbi:hypothetical protein DSO57_1012356 [Entomophthora muscae]|uniref:Uncharacterized protein n=1 Tax=Entomophthora muscae TaxID=34485 RepID=A0ACC2TH77_9FUNG|nr:hypothetical protein DSO57_1012356 [Entomophthora muscae]